MFVCSNLTKSFMNRTALLQATLLAEFILSEANGFRSLFGILIIIV